MRGVIYEFAAKRAFFEKSGKKQKPAPRQTCKGPEPVAPSARFGLLLAQAKELVVVSGRHGHCLDLVCHPGVEKGKVARPIGRTQALGRFQLIT